MNFVAPGTKSRNNMTEDHHALPKGVLTKKTSNIFSVHVEVVAKLTDFPSLFRGSIEFLCRRSVGFYSRSLRVFLMKESKKRRRKQPGKLMA